MRFDPSDRSSNIEVRSGGVGLGGGLGIGGVIILIIGAFLGIDPSTLLNSMESASPPAQQTTRSGSDALTPEQEFLANVLGTTEKVWSKLFAERGAAYRKPRLVVFEGATKTACGLGQAAMGPFYCPEDERLYVDLSFMRDLRTRFGAPGDFAQGYVIAHEVGHHVQNLSGEFRRLEAAKATGSRTAFNRASVQVELQADCYAGVWAYHAGAANKLDPGDIEEGLTAAAAVGDDRLQKQSQGRVVPESFTHGSSAQRVNAFRTGLGRGRPEDCAIGSR